MNLKTAARELGVHYQTAYRYVRTGELIAVKVGVGYEISEAAVERLRSRLSPTGTPVRVTRRATPDEPTIGADLGRLLHHITLSAQPMFDTMTRWLAAATGEACVLRLLSEDGLWLETTSSYHVEPTERARLDAMLRSTLQPVEGSPEAEVVREARVKFEHHIRPDVAIRFLPPAFRQYASTMLVSSLISVPVLSRNGRVRGVLSVARGASSPPFSDKDIPLVGEMADWVAQAIDRVSRFSAAWLARGTLLASVENLLSSIGGVTLDDVSDVVLDLLVDEMPEAVFSVDKELIAANSLFMSRFGLEFLPAGVIRISDGPLDACPAYDNDELWARLLSGEADFLDVEARGCATACPVVLGIHWAIARRADGTPGAVVATCDADGWRISAVAEAEVFGTKRCWGVCLAPGSRARIARR